MPRQYSKLGQEFWARENATVLSYLDIGTVGPIDQSATYLLDLEGWQGFCIGSGLDVASYRDVRRCDAILDCDPYDVDWKSFLPDVSVMGYLNIDMPDSADTVLQTLLQEIVFQCISVRLNPATNGSEYRDMARSVMKVHGYRPHRIDVDGVDFWLHND